MASFARRETSEREETTTESHETTDQSRPEVIMPIPIRPIRATPIAVRPRPPTPNSESPKNKMRKTERSTDGVVSSETEHDEAYKQGNSNKKSTRQAQESKDETETMNDSTNGSVNSTNSASNKVSVENLTNGSVDGNSSNGTATNARMNNNTPEITTKYNVVKIAPKIAPKVEDNRQSVIDFDKMVDDRSKQKLYPCPKCNRPFSRKFNMESHLTTHDPHRVKPFLCDYLGCGHRFTRKHDLKRHVNGIHKCEKQHRCPHCDKTFARKDAWKRHSFTCTINTEMPRVEKKIDSDAVRISLLANADATSVVVTETHVNK
ncbi:3023_t:CDS:1 [Paraglomus occultum]|uniref:3023_t:CDS:1 n=1 Tax=Paraglomus occultum TaxID=144539 RepID=A0A9N8Z0L2_9GLOM|nr:3023_t:CDS:1 [Paraglomus occultum]